ncbi:MAG TPA: HEAT repeat domain-containing protein [Methanomicrobiales archaeon]|jgi:hypothetical protein|nr:HEAT repeat domain-containing protein [Methanomicrobiales archaeon]
MVDMDLFSIFKPAVPDIEAMKRKKNIRGLISALQHQDVEIQLKAATALSSLGPDAIDSLIWKLSTRDRAVKLGIIGALGEIRDKRAVGPLTKYLKDPSAEVRWEVAIALGEIGDGQAIAPLLPGLRDKDRYVRYGTAIALVKLGWIPENKEDQALQLLGLQDWAGLAALGPAAVPALELALKDRDKTVRRKAAETLGEIGNEAAIPAIYRSLRDPDEEVRWRGTRAGPKCGIDPMHLPRGLSLRPRVRMNPYIAAFLNFILPGMGYTYLGRWWGVLVFQIDVTATLWLYAFVGSQDTYGLLFPLYIILAAHGWYLAKKTPEM